jgi:serine/threonine protein kinase
LTKKAEMPTLYALCLEDSRPTRRPDQSLLSVPPEGAREPAALETFHKECGVLASMAHPNIIEIFDLGEFEENGVSKPYFVMPLFPPRAD